MIADIIIIVTIVLFVLLGVRRGIAKTFFNIIGLVATVVSAYYLSQIFSQWIYDLFVKQTVITNLQTSINESGITSAFNNCLTALPDWVLGLLSGFCSIFGLNTDAISNSFKLPENISSVGATTIEGMIAPVITSLFAIILVIILFVIILIIVKKLIKLILRLFDIPVIKQVNKILGGVLGAVEGIVFMWIAVNVFYFIMFFTNPQVVSNNLVTGTIFNLLCLGS